MRLLHVDASARMEGSHSRVMTAEFIDRLSQSGAVDVDRLDLRASPPGHFGARETAAIYSASEGLADQRREALAASDHLVDRVLMADALVIGTPIYNFGMPSPLKAFFDHIARPGRTFRSDATGVRGLLGDKKVAVFSTAGGAYGAGDMFEGLDCLTPHIRVILSFLGVTDMAFVAARPMQFAGPDVAAQAMEDARRATSKLALNWMSGT